MEYVGRKVKKLKEGKDISGVVRSYYESTRLFAILYEDGDSEELKLSELVLIEEESVGGDDESGGEGIELEKAESDRKAKKRRRDDAGSGVESGNGSDSVANESDHAGVLGTLEKIECKLSEEEFLHGNAVNRADGSNMKLDDNDLSHVLNLNVATDGDDCAANLNDAVKLDDILTNGSNLNDVVKLDDNLSDGLNVNVAVAVVVSPETKCISLDLNVGGDVEIKKRERSFDLNLGLDEVNKNECGVEMKGSDGFQTSEKTPRKMICGLAADTQNVRNGSLRGLGYPRVSDTNCVEEMDRSGYVVARQDGGDIGSSYKSETSAVKRRKVSDNNLTPTKEPSLRRSARRGNSTFSTPTRVSEAANNDPSSPIISVASEEKPATTCRESPEETSVDQLKLELPASSQNLDVDGIPVLDIFSIYSCLRSFSYLLFLSPFELEEFVTALRCESSNSLLDSIHVSILLALRKHLEFLSTEGSQSATSCLRSLDWSLLDMITWPLFMVEYLLIHGSPLRPEFDLSRLKLLERDYYKQPACVKAEMLRCLCDDVIEVEAIRSDLSRRSLVVDPASAFERTVTPRLSKKRRAAMDIHRSSSLDAEVDETGDWNSDECCLCKMDGTLICCDGCPAAYHSRCVGVASELLPEGDWFCPECVINKDKPWVKLQSSLRGAELLGQDPHGRSYYSSCGYLLVLESPDLDSSVTYYHRYDLPAIVELLKSSDIRFGSILNAICKYWNIPIHGREATCYYKLQKQESCPGIIMKEQNNATLPHSGAFAVKDDILVEPTANLFHTVCSNNDLKISSVVETTNDSDDQGKAVPLGDSCVTTSTFDTKQVTNMEFADPGCSTTYMNYYNFAWVASLIYEDLLHYSDKSKVDSVKSAEEIIAKQLMSISKNYSDFCWHNFQSLSQHVLKENCGWCYSCRTPEDASNCLFTVNDAEPIIEGCKTEAIDTQFKQYTKGHLSSVKNHMLDFEDCLRGLLLGPWLNPHYSLHWRTSVLKATDVSSLKIPLLTIESNLNRRALSGEWLKQVDSFVAMGSSSHLTASLVSMVPKNGKGKKGGKADPDYAPTSKAPSGLTLYWWRGGRVSRSLFNWKVLPHDLARKAARQSGCNKIPGVLYSESSDFAKRNKNVAWKAVVETSTSAEQIAYAIRELDSNIRWDRFGNTHHEYKKDEFKKSVRPFRKVVIRRKSVEGNAAKYLLDFGKRKKIPDIVVKHGSILEESSSGRKKFWLEEVHVPLHLLKAFEEKHVSRKGNKMNRKPIDRMVNKKPRTRKDFLYLFTRTENSATYQCGHCNEAVLIREAVSCHSCEDYFHKKHIKKSDGAIPDECVYTCHKCKELEQELLKNDSGKRIVKANSKFSPDTKPTQSIKIKKPGKGKSKVGSQKKVVPAVVPLRRSARNLVIVSLPKRKRGRPRKGNEVKSKQEPSPKKTKEVASWQKKKKRSYTDCSYWLKGLRMSKRPNDERVLDFKKKKLRLPLADSNVIPYTPKCSLDCEAGHTATMTYIGCETCKGPHPAVMLPLDPALKAKHAQKPKGVVQEAPGASKRHRAPTRVAPVADAGCSTPVLPRRRLVTVDEGFLSSLAHGESLVEDERPEEQRFAAIGEHMGSLFGEVKRMRSGFGAERAKYRAAAEESRTETDALKKKVRDLQTTVATLEGAVKKLKNKVVAAKKDEEDFVAEASLHYSQAGFDDCLAQVRSRPMEEWDLLEVRDAELPPMTWPPLRTLGTEAADMPTPLPDSGPSAPPTAAVLALHASAPVPPEHVDES